MADESHVTRKGGKIVDTIPTFIWRRVVGGLFHDSEIIMAKDLRKNAIVFGEADQSQTYVRKSRVMQGFRLVAFVADDLPRTKFWPFMAMRSIAWKHPELMQITKQEADA